MEPSRPVRDTLLQILCRVSRAVGLHTSRANPASAHQSGGEETEEATEEDDDEEDYTMLSDDEAAYNVGSFTAVPTNQLDITTLQRQVSLTI